VQSIRYILALKEVKVLILLCFQNNFLECGGFQVLSYLLEQMPPTYFTTETISTLDLLANAILSNGNISL
jgi:hypothetical protein